MTFFSKSIIHHIEIVTRLGTVASFTFFSLLL